MKLPIHYKSSHYTYRKKAREEYTRLQEGKCYHCKEPLISSPPKEILALPLNMELFPPNFLTYPIHLHHDHDSGFTIGSVHSYCNGVLWQYHGI